MWTTVFLIFGFAAVAGIALGLLFIIPVSIYILPYMTWLGWNQGSNGIPKKQGSQRLSGCKYLLHQVHNATRLYRSWITHTPHNITDW